MGDIRLTRAIFFCWVLWTSQIEASNTKKFERKVEQSEITKLCSVTGPDNLYCINCLNGPDPDRSENDDTEIMLGAKTIRCAHNAAVTAGNVMNDFSKNSTGDLQAAATFCVPKLETTSESFNEAIGFWSEKKKDQALEKIKFGRDRYYECAYHVPTESPSSLYHVLNSARSLGEVAEFVITSINV